MQILLRREFICTDTDKDMACPKASGKSFLCAHDGFVTVYVFGCIYIYRGLSIFPFFHSIRHGISSFETIVGRLFLFCINNSKTEKGAVTLQHTLMVGARLVDKATGARSLSNLFARAAARW